MQDGGASFRRVMSNRDTHNRVSCSSLTYFRYPDQVLFYQFYELDVILLLQQPLLLL